MALFLAALALAAYTVETGGDTVRSRSDRSKRDSNPPGASFARVVQNRLLGHSAGGRPIRVTAFGTPRTGPKVLVVGCIHGTECASRAVVRRLIHGCPPTRADLWALDDLNPDGFAVSNRLNGQGVDLNRNFSSGWRPIGGRGDPEYSGPRPFSEPETRIARRLIRQLRPDTTIWFHQQAQPLVRAWGQSVSSARRFARFAALPFQRLHWLAGTAPNWQNHEFPGTSSFVVELPAGRLDRTDSLRYAAAIERSAGYVGQNRIALEGARKLRHKRRLVLARPPYMGVACRIPNSIACDRVGLAVYMPKRRPAERLTASINGRPVRMKIPAAVATRGIYFEGFLRHAGLKRGSLKVTAGKPLSAMVRITAYYRDRSSRFTVRRVGLAPGWG
jgi:protein MpaA